MLLAILAALLAGAVATSNQELAKPVHPSQGLPTVGQIWGPVITHAGKMQLTKDGLRHKYRYPIAGKKDVLADYILASEIFQNKTEMYRHIKSALQDDHVIIQTDPASLEGKYLEGTDHKQRSP